jgi:hypothetical protein
MLDEITTLAEWRDKILLGEWNSFGTRGEFLMPICLEQSLQV